MRPRSTLILYYASYMLAPQWRDSLHSLKHALRELELQRVVAQNSKEWDVSEHAQPVEEVLGTLMLYFFQKATRLIAKEAVSGEWIPTAGAKRVDQVGATAVGPVAA